MSEIFQSPLFRFDEPNASGHVITRRTCVRIAGDFYYIAGRLCYRGKPVTSRKKRLCKKLVKKYGDITFPASLCPKLKKKYPLKMIGVKPWPDADRHYKLWIDEAKRLFSNNDGLVLPHGWQIEVIGTPPVFRQPPVDISGVGKLMNRIGAINQVEFTREYPGEFDNGKDQDK